MTEDRGARRRCLRCGVEPTPDAIVCSACGTTLSESSTFESPLAPRPIASWTPADTGAVPAFSQSYAPESPISRGPVLHVPPVRHQVPAYLGSPTPAPRRTGLLKGTLIALLVGGLVAGAVWGIVVYSNNLIDDTRVDVADRATGQVPQSPSSINAPTTPEPWITFSPSGDGYTIEFPSQPTKSFEAGETVYGVEYPGGHSALMVSKAQLPRAATDSQIPAVLRGAADGMVGSAGDGATVVSSDIVDGPMGATGRLEMSTPNGKIFAQTLVRGRRLYIVVGVIGDADGELMALNWVRFRDSFRLS